uniref:Hydrocephalus-inducing protein homolog n=1 Tax=Cacopsylla melanoneura TaxID=428564 RepID=A0A8D8Z6F9_9HEMI
MTSCTVERERERERERETGVLVYSSQRPTDSELVPSPGSIAVKNNAKSSGRRKDKTGTTGEMTSPQQTKGDEIFDVEAKNFTILPHCSTKLKIIFKPVAIEDYKGMVTVILPANPHGENLTFTVLGQVTVPQIAILEPALNDDNKLVVSMNPTLMSKRSLKQLRFQNICKVVAHVILEIHKNEDGIFKVIPTTDTLPLLLVEAKEITYTTLINMKPGDVAQFNIEFKPLMKGRTTGEIYLYITNNMYEKFVVYMIGICHDDPFDVKGLTAAPLSLISAPRLPPTTSHSPPPVSVKSPTRRNEKKSPVPPSLGAEEHKEPDTLHSYEVDLGAIPVGEERWHTFHIFNTSEDGIWRYKFSCENQDLVVIPNLGHIGPQSTSLFTIAFKASQEFNGVIKILGTLTPISLTEDPELGEVPLNFNWDISLSSKPDITLLSAFVPKKPLSPRLKELPRPKELEPANKPTGKKISTALKTKRDTFSDNALNQYPEPKYTIMKAIEPTPFKIDVKLVAALCKFAVTESELDFSFISCYQEKIMKLKVLNPSLVPVKVQSSFLSETKNPISSFHIRDLIAISSSPVGDIIHIDTPRSDKTSRNVSAGTTRKSKKPTGHLDHHAPKLLDSLESVCPSNKSSPSPSMTESEGEEEPKIVPPPFSVSPTDEVTIDPLESCVYSIKFRPTQEFSYGASLGFFRIPSDPDSDLTSHYCTLEGSGSMPCLHMEVPESALATTPEIEARVSARTNEAGITRFRVLVFNVLGDNDSHIMNIRMTNISSTKVTYSWKHMGNIRTTYLSESCVADPCTMECTEKPDGRLSPGNQNIVSFTFHPFTLGISECHYKLLLNNENIVDFLFVGVAREPRVCLSNKFLKLSSTFASILSSDSIFIKNKEPYELNFQFIASSLCSEGKQEVLEVFPFAGTLAPNSITPIKIQFVPRSSGDVVFHVQCSISKRSTPLELDVSCRVYSVNVEVTLISDLGENMKLYPFPAVTNTYTVGRINVNVRQIYCYRISNLSLKGMAYEWNARYIKKSSLVIKVDIPIGRVPPQASVSGQFSVLVKRDSEFNADFLELQIKHGPLYKIQLEGIARDLPYQIYPKVVDFASCLITAEEVVGGN